MEDILSPYFKCTFSAITHKLNVSGHMLILTFVLVLVYGTRAQRLSVPFSYTLYVYNVGTSVMTNFGRKIKCMTVLVVYRTFLCLISVGGTKEELSAARVLHEGQPRFPVACSLKCDTQC
jgi:hypothetical protein